MPTLASGALILVLSLQGALAQAWTSNAVLKAYWTGVASSADGAKLVAVSGESCCGTIYTSTNFGTTWTARVTPAGGAWSGVASSADGSRLVAVSINGLRACISGDSGLTWTSPSTAFPPFFQFEAVSCSADAHLLLASGMYYADNPLYELYRSIDGGTNWTVINALQMRIAALCSSGDGKIVFAGAKPGLIYTSTDEGVTWTGTAAPSDCWHALCCSLDGKRVYAAPNGTLSGCWTPNVLYLSKDSGATWTSNAIPVYGITKLACSADGRRVLLLAAGLSAGEGRILTSTDEGVTWAEQAVPSYYGDPWCGGAASSADGHSLLVASSDSLYSLKTTPAPALRIHRMEDGVSLSWSVPSAPFVLQESAELSSTGWNDLTLTPDFDPAAAQYTVPIPWKQGPTFYRLLMR